MPNHYNPVSDVINSYDAGQRANYYDLQTRALEDQLRTADDTRRAMNLYGDYGTAPGVAESDLRQMYRDQGIPGSVSEPIVAKVNEPRKQRLSNMALAALSIDDSAEQKDAFKFIHSQLSPEEQKQYGSPDKWTRAGIVSFIGNDDVKSMLGQWKTMREVLSEPQLYTNPETNKQEMWYFDKSGKPRSKVRDATKADLAKGSRRAGGITLSQQSHNDEIDQARAELAKMGLAKADVLRLTKKFTDTGRDNPDFDPGISKLVSLAVDRKTGDDPDYQKVYSNFMGAGGAKKVEPVKITLPATVKKTSEAISYLMKNHKMTKDQAVKWIQEQ